MAEEPPATDQPLSTYRAVTGRGVIEYRLLADRLEAAGLGRFRRFQWRSITPLRHLDSSFQEEERLYVDRWWAALGGIIGGCVGALIVYLLELATPAMVLIPVVGFGIGTVAIKQSVAGWATFPAKAAFARGAGMSVWRCERQPIERERFLEFVKQVSAQIARCSKAPD